jgi:hypothetical protein
MKQILIERYLYSLEERNCRKALQAQREAWLEGRQGMFELAFAIATPEP